MKPESHVCHAMIYLQGYHSDIKAKAYAQQWMAAK
jgi:hypothetical protein